jgi:hypothetical protein
MAKNGKASTMQPEIVDALPEELQESKEKLDAILDADFTDPTKNKLGRGYFSNNNPAYRYYQTIAPKLARWWDEFSGELDPKNGGPRYRTVHQFAVAKSKDAREQEWIAQMIGPEPAAFNWKCKDNGKNGKWLRVPWLGDWKARRTNGYWAPEHPAKIKSLVRSLKDKLQGFEAVQSSAPYLVQEMATYMRLSEQVDQVFAGQALDLNEGISDKNKARFYTYLEMKKAVTRVKLRLLHEWWTCHGLSTNGQPVMITQVNQMFQNAGMATPAGMMDTNVKDLQAIKLARMLQTHAENFDMPLPEDQPPKKEPEKVHIKTNGKQVM